MRSIKIFLLEILLLLCVQVNGQMIVNSYSVGSNGFSFQNDNVSYWNLNGSGEDISGGNNHLENSPGTTTYATGKIGNGAVFNGSTAYLQAVDNTNLSFGNGTVDTPFSYSFWLKPTAAPAANAWIVSKRSIAGARAEYQITFGSNRTVQIALFSQNNTVVLLGRTCSALTLDVMYFITCTYDGTSNISGLKIYVNGVLDNATNTSAGSYVAMNNTTEPLFIGSEGGLTAGRFFTGTVDEIALFNKTLSLAEIQELYSNGNGKAYAHGSPTMYETSMYVLATNGNYQFARDNRFLYFSDDRGATWKNRYDWGTMYQSTGDTFIYNKYPHFAYVFSDGTVLFATAAKVYRSTDQIATVTEVTNILDTNGSPFTFHTPNTASRPGNYFKMPVAGITSHMNVNGVEMIAWINYTNQSYLNGASPVVCWYTIDKGATIKAFYKFGQNPQARDNGAQGGSPTGTLLGDAGNSVVCWHGHGIQQRQGTNEFYFGTGDYDPDRVGFSEEVHDFKCVYDSNADTWTVTKLTDSDENSRYKISAIVATSDNIYWGSDATGTSNPVPSSEFGVFKASYSDFLVQSSVRVGYPNSQNVSNHGLMINQNNGKMMILGEGVTGDFQTGFYVVDNYGAGAETFVTVPGKPVNAFYTNPFPPDSRGYIKVNIGGFKFAPVKTIFYKL